MKIGIILYSQTGNTRSVAAKLKDALAAGHSVALEEVKVAGGRNGGGRDFKLEAGPNPATYDALVFGSPVEAFSLSPVMKAYLGGLGPLQGKKVGYLVTEGLPYPWLGGNRAVRTMRKLCEGKGAVTVGSAVVNWMGSRRDERIQKAVERLAGDIARP